MNRNQVEVVGLPSGAKAVGIVQWTALNDERVWPPRNQDVYAPRPGETRTDYLVAHDGLGFVIVGLNFPVKSVRYEAVSSAKVWHW